MVLLKTNKMKKFAVIDVGSNSVRLLFVADGFFYKRLQTTRLGEGISKTPVLLPAAIERTAQAIAAFYAQAIEEGAEEVLCFATAAVRAAENRQAFLERVRALCPLAVEVISGEEEAEIGLLGALGNRDGGVIDIGGASTEIVVKKEGRIIYKKSVNIGVVRLKDSCGREQSALIAAAKRAAKEYEGLPACNGFYGIGGTATTLAAQALHLTEYASDKVTGAVLTVEDVEGLAEKFDRMTVEEIASLPCMPVGRADVVLGGAVLLSTLMRALNIPQITVSDRDNLEGYAIKRGYIC